MLSLPGRSPDFNLMDYSAWSEVERRLRAQEKKFPATKHETRAEFTRRLDRASRNIPKQFIDKSISDLPWCCERLYQAKGGFFEEGGRRRRPHATSVAEYNELLRVRPENAMVPCGPRPHGGLSAMPLSHLCVAT